jgi:hypothetical protein
MIPRLPHPGRSLLFAAVFTLSLTGFIATRQANAWGQIGHRVVGEIAERNLSAISHKALAEIVEKGETLAELSTWADHIRSDPSWDFVQPWHYISIDDEETWDDFERDEDGDILKILDTLEAFLRDKDATELTLEGPPKKRGSGSKLPTTQQKNVTKRQALALYVHMVGDLHQPLHVGRRDDQGGNRIQVKWFDEEVTLHRLWDEKLISSTELSYTEFTLFLNRASDQQREAWQQGSYLEWAKDSKAVRLQLYDFGAQRSSYFLNVKEAPNLGYDYRANNIDLLYECLQKGGYRLAAKLNSIFEGE